MRREVIFLFFLFRYAFLISLNIPISVRTRLRMPTIQASKEIHGEGNRLLMLMGSKGIANGMSSRRSQIIALMAEYDISMIEKIRCPIRDITRIGVSPLIRMK